MFAQLSSSNLQKSAALPEVEEGSAPAGECEAEPSIDNSKQKRKRGSGKASAKVKVPELIDLGLDETQRREVISYFAEKAPSGQNDQVAVLGVALKKHLKRSEFNVDEVHSAFKIVQKPTPKNLFAVFGNMKRAGKSGYANSCLVVNAYTEDHVNFHMEADKKGEK